MNIEDKKELDWWLCWQRNCKTGTEDETEEGKAARLACLEEAEDAIKDILEENGNPSIESLNLAALDTETSHIAAVTERDQKTINEMLGFWQQSDDPYTRALGDYIVNLQTVVNHEGTKH
jgi:hypothetical protein